jgi:uncharacterized protein (TIGR02453 family)
MNIPGIYQYLRELATNNNRDWFNEHKDRYLQVQADFNDFLSKAIACIGQFDESVLTLQPKDCVYRIYRDTRFSLDKTPYKNHIGAFINVYGKSSYRPGYYIHMQPDASLIAGGSWFAPSPILKIVRQAIYDNIEEYLSIVTSAEFKHYYPIVGDDFLKTAPKGFKKDWEYIDYIRPRNFGVELKVNDNFFSREDVLEEMANAFRQAKRLGDFLDYSISEYDENNR